MAKIGLKNFRFGILTENLDGSATYGVGQKPAKAISCTVDISNNDVKLYADDALAESDTSFQSGSVTLGIDDEDDTMLATLLGHQIVGGVLVRNSSDVAPYVGLGRIITKMVNGAYKYKVEFLKKVKFSEPSQENNTKGESLEFGTSELSGQVACLANGDWSESKTFNTMNEAQTYLDSLFGAGTAATVASVPVSWYRLVPPMNVKPKFVVSIHLLVSPVPPAMQFDEQFVKGVHEANNIGNRETFLVLDATTGQNAVYQAKEFKEASKITGLVLTKLDGTAKGGIVISIKNELNIPVKFIGVGEKIDDMQEFDAAEFIAALFE